MESSLCLSFCSSSVTTPNIPFTMSVKQATNLRSIGNSSVSLSNISTSRPLQQVLRPVICANDKSSTYSEQDKGENRNKIVKGTVGVSLILACAVGIMSCSSKMNPRAIAGPKEMYQKVPSTSVFAHPIGGRLALNSFLEGSTKLASSKAEPFYLPKYTVPPGPSIEDVYAIKNEALRQMKSGKPEVAVNLLRKVFEDCKNEPEPAYNVEMALVEILIYQGKYSEALNCNCLKDEQRMPSDGRFPLYKAIIYTMLNTGEARQWWEEFVETIEDEI